MTGADLRSWRMSRCLTQFDAAGIFNVAVSAMAKMERNVLRVRPEVVATAREYDEFCGRSAERPRSEIIAEASADYEITMAPYRKAISDARQALRIAEASAEAAQRRANAERMATITRARQSAVAVAAE